MNNILFSTTSQIAAGIRDRKYTAVEVLEAHLRQIERHNPTLNAVVTFNVEAARKRARAADEALIKGELWGPLHGVPFTLKDAFATAGVQTTTGYPPFADLVPSMDSTIAARLKAAGAILMGKTNVFTMLADPAQTFNPIFGRTNNPWNPERTPGGSSGGAAAAVASGMTPFDIGTDLSGSIRIPSHFCGVFGLKPTDQRVSLEGLIPGLQSPRSVRLMSCIGPLARSVEDLDLLFQITAGPDGWDTEVHPVPVEPMPALELKGLRIAFCPTFPGFPVSSEIRKAIVDLAAQLDQIGAIVDEADLPKLDFGQELAHAGELIEMITGVFQEQDPSHAVSLAAYLAALDRRDGSIRAWEQFFEGWDALLCPPTCVTAFPHCEPGTPLRVDGQEVSYWMVSAHTAVFNFSGHPAVVLPYRRDRDGLPLGVQLVGKRWGESRLLAVARAVTQLTGDFVEPPGYS